METPWEIPGELLVNLKILGILSGVGVWQKSLFQLPLSWQIALMRDIYV